MSHKKFGPDRFSRFDVYWIQTNKQTPIQAKFIYGYTKSRRLYNLYNSKSIIFIQSTNISQCPPRTVSHCFTRGYEIHLVKLGIKFSCKHNTDLRKYCKHNTDLRTYCKHNTDLRTYCKHNTDLRTYCISSLF